MQTNRKSLAIAISAVIAAGVMVVPQWAVAEKLALEEVIVSARKQNETLQDVPLAVSAFDSQAIDKLSLRSIDDIARFTPGLSFSKAFGRSTERPVIRGQGNILAGVQFGVESGVAYFVDGAYYSGGVQSLNLDNLERVEVIKGPQSALYGRNSYSGAINFVTRSPIDRAENKLKVIVAEDGEEDLNAFFSGPLIANKLGGTLSLRSYKFDGQWTNQVTNEEIGDEETQSINGSLEWNATDRLRIRTRLGYAEDDDGTRPFFLQPATENNCYPGYRSLEYRPATGAAPRNPYQYFCGEIKARPIALNDGRDADGVPNVIPGYGTGTSATAGAPWYRLDKGVAFSGIERDTFNATLLGDYSFDNGYTLNVNTTMRNENTDTGSDSDHSSINFWPVFAPFNGTNEAFFANSESSAVEDSSIEVRFSSPSENAFRWMTGIFYYDYEDDRSDIVFTGSTPAAQDNKIQNRAMFASVAYDFTEKLTTTVEARYAEENKSQKDRNAANVVTYDNDVNFYSVTPRLTLDYQVNDEHNLYATYSEGVKPGGLNGIQGFAVGSPDYGEEESKNIEFGVKSTWLDGRVSSDIAIFFNDITDYQLTNALPNLNGAAITSIVTNQGEGEVKGFEFDIKANITENLSSGVTYALADSEFTDGCDEFQWVLTSGGGLWRGSEADSLNPNGQGDCSIDGNQFPISSKHQASAYLDWASPLVGDWEFIAGINATYESKKYVQVHNEAYVGNATIVGLRAGVQSEQWEIVAFGRNINDEDSAVLATRWFGTAGGSYSGPNGPGALSADTGGPRAFFGAPRREQQWGVELTYNF